MSGYPCPECGRNTLPDEVCRGCGFTPDSALPADDDTNRDELERVREALKAARKKKGDAA